MVKLKNKYLVLISCFLFVFSMIIGGLLAYSFDTMQNISGESKFVHISRDWYGVFSVFKTNIYICILLIIGLFTFSFITILLLAFNGFFVGFSIISSLIYNGSSLSEICMSIIPHGIFEIPAIIISGFIGLKGLKFYFVKDKEWKKNMFLILLIIGLVFIGSIIEGFLTPIL